MSDCKVIPFKPNDAEHKCQCGGKCGSHKGQHTCKCGGKCGASAEGSAGVCYVLSPTIGRVNIHLEERSGEHCDFVQMIDTVKVSQIHIAKLSDGIKVSVTACDCISPDGKRELEVYTYPNINAQQFVEIYTEDGDLISENALPVLVSAICSGEVAKADMAILADGYKQMFVGVDELWFSVVVHPQFDYTKPIGFCYHSSSGFVFVAGWTEQDGYGVYGGCQV